MLCHWLVVKFVYNCFKVYMAGTHELRAVHEVGILLENI